MIFSSIEASALPYRVGQPVNVYPQEFGTIVVRALEPAHPANPILVKYRQSDERTQWHMRAGSWISWPAPPWPDGAPEHARKVLSRLANWKEGNR